MRHAALRWAAVRGAAAVRHGPVGYAVAWQATAWQAVAWQATAWQAAAWYAITGYAITVAGYAAMARACARGAARRKPAWLAWGRASRLAEPLLLPGRHFARPAKQLSVVVFLDVYRSARSGRIILLVLGGGVALIGGIVSRTVAAAIPLAPGRTVRVAAEAGVATFHQIPPGLWCPAAPRDICPYLSSVGRQKSPV